MTAQGIATNDELPSRIRETFTEQEQDVYRVAYNNALAREVPAPAARFEAMQAVNMLKEVDNG